MAPKNQLPNKKRSPKPSGSRDETQATPPTNIQATTPTNNEQAEIPKHRWTVMVYLAGDNNLSEECAFDISEMKAANYCDNGWMQVLVQFDPRSSRLPTQRFSIKDEIDPIATKRREKVPPGPTPRYRLGETSTGSPRTLYDFIVWGIQKYPAHSYLVVLAGHGGGIEENFLLRDENPNGTISLREIKDVFRCIHDDFGVVIDIVGLDTCLMSMAEVAYQLKDNAGILIGSEGYSPLGGWPYRAILEMLSKQSAGSENRSKEGYDPKVLGAESRWVAREIVCTYANSYLEYIAGGIDVDQAAIDITRCDELTPKVARLASRLKWLLLNPQPNSPFKEALILAHWDAQSYDGEIYVDLRDFCDCLMARTVSLNCHDPEIDDACCDISNLIGEPHYPCSVSERLDDPNYYVLKSCYTGPSLQYSYGVSLYFPWYEVMPYYGDLDFAQATKWHEFLQVYVKETRRRRRNDGKAGYRDLLGDPDSTTPIKQSSGKQSSGKDDRPIIRSMRNPPIALKGLSNCFDEDKVNWVDKIAGQD
ncbi:MAG TPA: clostripain-related cysteine peptidase [Pyrinomonadaceae bacterium]|nr:clostripain-related cysteine peptidase [Pyrinomonadaceae bacterium]